MEAPSARRLTPKGQRSRDAIVAAASEELAERGYDATSMSAIARRAGVAKSVIYDHFESKADLYAAIVETCSREMSAHVRDTLPPRGAGGRLQVGVDAHFEFLERHPVAWRLLVRDPPAEPELLDVHRRAAAERSAALAALMEKPRDEEHRRRKELFAGLLITTIQGLAVWWYDHRDVPRAEIVAAVMAIVRSGIDRAGGPLSRGG